MEEGDVGSELGFVSAFAFGAHDESEAFGHEFVSYFAESFAFFTVFDFAAEGEVVALGHEDDVSAREADACGDSGAFGTSGAFGDLDHELLSGFDELFDFASAEFGPSDAGGGCVSSFVGDDVGDVEEGVSFESDVDECGVHSGEDVLDDAFEDGSNDALFALDPVLHEFFVFEEGDTGFPVGAVDEDFDSLGALAGVSAGRGSRG